VITVLKVIFAAVFLATVVGTILLLVYGFYVSAVCLGGVSIIFGVMVAKDVIERVRGSS